MSSLIPTNSDEGSSAWASALIDYFANIGRAITSTFEGLSVTSSWLFRQPLTIQYPDRSERPVRVMLPDTYRGVLEVDLCRCTGCMLCSRACPIDAILLKVAKNPETKTREIQQFDIDIGLCMYCGLCVEACKFDSLVHTAEFEAATDSPEGLVVHFVDAPVPVSKHKSGQGPARVERGSILRKLVPAIPEREPWMGAGSTERKESAASEPPKAASEADKPAQSGGSEESK
jgi:formate hydrogenlyase subunit 6/NADH:ubiquinone oxidoreductase subunit I